MNFDSLIFDVDGTLWDAVDSVADGFSEASEYFEYGPKRFDRGAILPELGKPLNDIFRDLYPEIDAENDPVRADELLDEIGDLSIKHEYSAIERSGGRLYPGVKETLAKLKKEHGIYIVSNCEQGYIELFMEKTGTEEFFDGWLCYGDTGEDKDVTIKCLIDDYGLENPCYIGDIENDAICAKKAGAGFIWAAYGFGNVSEDLYDRKIDEFAELEDIIG